MKIIKFLLSLNFLKISQENPGTRPRHNKVPRNGERQANSSLEAARQEPRNRKVTQEKFSTYAEKAFR